MLTEIQELTNRIEAIGTGKDKSQTAFAKRLASTAQIQYQLSDVVHAMAESYRSSETPVVWKDVEEDKARIKRWLRTDVSDGFFGLGGLKQVVQFLGNSELNGTDDERAKYEKLQTLSYKLLLLDVRTNYTRTFAGMYFIPLAIQNISTMQDENIHVLVNIEIGEIVKVYPRALQKAPSISSSVLTPRLR